MYTCVIQQATISVTETGRCKINEHQAILGVYMLCVQLSVKNDAVVVTTVIVSLLCMYMNLLYSCRILDDEELFVQQKHFTVVDLVEMSTILNTLVFRMVWECPSSPAVTLLLPPCHSLLMLLYNRDSRRTFCERELWLVRFVHAKGEYS